MFTHFIDLHYSNYMYITSIPNTCYNIVSVWYILKDVTVHSGKTSRNVKCTCHSQGRRSEWHPSCGDCWGPPLDWRRRGLSGRCGGRRRPRSVCWPRGSSAPIYWRWGSYNTALITALITACNRAANSYSMAHLQQYTGGQHINIILIEAEVGSDNCKLCLMSSLTH